MASSVSATETRWGGRYPKVVGLVLRRIEDFLRFFAEPIAFWTALRSTNLLERLNRELRRRLRPAGAMQSELELWKLIWSSTTEQEKRWGTRRVWAPRATRQEAAA